MKKYPIGAIAEGPVTSLTNFGCFIDLGGGTTVRFYISDITGEKSESSSRGSLVGQTVRAAVLEVDRERRRIKLGIKYQSPPPPTNTWLNSKGRNRARPDCRKLALGEPKRSWARAQFAECQMREDLKREAVREWVRRARTGCKNRPCVADRNVISEVEARSRGRILRSSKLRAAGQVRTFPNRKLDQPNKKIEVELAG